MKKYLKVTILSAFLLCVNNLFAYHIDHVTVWWTQNGSTQSHDVAAAGTYNLSRDAGTPVNIRIYKSNTAPSPSNFSWIAPPISSGEEVSSYNSYVDFDDVAPAGLLYIQCMVNLISGNVKIYVTDLITQYPDISSQFLKVDGHPYQAGYQFSVGQTITAGCRIINTGEGQAGTSKVGFYLGTSSTDYSSSARYNHQHTGPLGHNEIEDEESDPYTFTTDDIGTRYLNFFADYTNDVEEGSGEGNNKQSWGAFTVVGSPVADIQDISYPAGPINPNEPFILNVYMKNTGTLAATDGGISVSFPEITETNASGNNTSYTSSQATVMNVPSGTTLPTVLAYGNGTTIWHSNGSPITNHYLLMEGTENTWNPNDGRVLALMIWPQLPGVFHMKIRGWLSNGTVSISRDPGTSGTGIGTDQQGYFTFEKDITVNNVLPDLVVTALNTPATAEAGNTYQISLSVQNAGTMDCPASAGELRISYDQNFDNGDYLCPRDLSAIAIGQTYTTPLFPITIPLTGFTGNCYLIYKADVPNTIQELNELNNELAQPISIGAPLLITVTEPSTNISINQGDPVTISWNANGPEGSTVILKYDPDTDPNNQNETTIIDGQPLTGSHSWNTANVPPNTYYISGTVSNGSASQTGYAPGTVTINNTGTITVTGWVRYYDHIDQVSKNGRKLKVKVWDDDGLVGDDLLWEGWTQEDGHFTTYPISNAYNETDGHQDVYVEVYAENSAAIVRSNDLISPLSIYSINTAKFDNVENGIVDFGIISPMYDFDGPFHIADVLLSGQNAWENLRPQDLLFVPLNVIWSNDMIWYGYSTLYNSNYMILYVRGDIVPGSFYPDEFDDGLLLHEYGHYLEDVFDFFDAGSLEFGETHDFWDEISLELAASEGFATFWSSLVQNDTLGYKDWKMNDGIYNDWRSFSSESGLYWDDDYLFDCCYSNSKGSDCEASVLGMLWDLHDNNDDDRGYLINDPPDGIGDTYDNGINKILSVIMDRTINGHRPDNSDEFWTLWFSDPSNGSEQKLWAIWYEHGDNKDLLNPNIPNISSCSHILNQWSNDPTINVAWTCTDNGPSHIKGYSVVWNHETNTTPADGISGFGFSTTSDPLANGNNWYIHVKAIDSANNYGNPVHYGPFKIDLSLPTGSIVINNGAPSTTSNTVNLTISAADDLSGVSQMKLSNDGTSSWSEWEPYSTNLNWNIFLYGGNSSYGMKTVYIKFKDVAGNESTTYDDNIEYIQAVLPPSITYFTINNGDVNTTSTTVYLNNGATNDPTHYMASESSSFTGASWQTYSTSPAFTLSSGYGTKTVYFKVKNDAGTSGTSQDNIIYSMTVNISGYVKDGSNVGINNVTVTFDNGGGTATTNVSGYYAESVPYGYSGTATPYKPGWSFNLPNHSYSNVTTNLTNENFTGIPISIPVIVVSNNSLPDFGSVQAGNTSQPQQYTVSGSFLTGNILISAPDGFQISTNSISDFGPTITLVQSGGTIANTIIYAIFAPTSGLSYSNNITHASPGASSQNVFVTGNQMPSGLIAYYPFINGSFNDESGHNHHGTNFGSIATANKDGVADNAMSFDGNDDYIWLGNDPEFKQPVISIAAWFRTANSQSTQKIYRWRWYGIEMGVNLGNLYGEIYTLTTPYICTSQSNISNDLWHFATFTFNGSIARLYLNGLLVDEQNIPDPIYYSFEGAAIGRDGDFNGFYFDGEIDEVQIYDRALLQAEINSLMVFTTPMTRNLINQTIQTGQNNCFDATQTITVAGSGTNFTVQNGGSATMIAGQNIKYLPTTIVSSGGYMHGYISTNGQYCGTQAPSVPAVAAGEEPPTMIVEKPSFKIYPNPTTGKFSLELIDGELSTNTVVKIYNMLGKEVLRQEFSAARETDFSLENQAPGIYMVSLIIDGKMETVKILKH